MIMKRQVFNDLDRTYSNQHRLVSQRAGRSSLDHEDMFKSVRLSSLSVLLIIYE